MSVTAFPTPVVCWEWHLWFLADEPVQGRACRDCGKPVAVPIREGARPALCVPCGMGRGLVPLEDRPLELGPPTQGLASPAPTR